MVLGWLVYHQKQAMDAQKAALEATKATVEALKGQSDLRIDPLKETIISKEGAIQALQAQLAAAAERKALAEDKLKSNQEQLNQLLAELPSELGRLIRAEVDKERTVTLQIAGNLFYNAGYYTGVANLAGLILQVQVLAFARHEKKNLEAKQFAITVAVEYMKDSVLFLNRERRLALEGCVELIRGPNIKIPAVLLDQLGQLSAIDKMAAESGLSIDADAIELSSMTGFPVDLS
jgi:hypothetical protein